MSKNVPTRRAEQRELDFKGLKRTLGWIHPNWQDWQLDGFIETKCGEIGSQSCWLEFTSVRTNDQIVAAAYVERRPREYQKSIASLSCSVSSYLQEDKLFQQKLTSLLRVAHRDGSSFVSCNLLHSAGTQTRQVLRKAGFLMHTKLNHLGKVLPDRAVDSSERVEGFNLIQANQIPMLEFVDLLQATQSGSKDFVGKKQFRESYSPTIIQHLENCIREDFKREAALFNPMPNSWFVVRDESQNRNCGCVLLKSASAATGTELVYLGLIPEFRGQGVGSGILNFLPNLVRMSSTADTEESDSSRCISTIVDTDNEPAKRIYMKNGFVVLRESELWMRPL